MWFIHRRRRLQHVWQLQMQCTFPAGPRPCIPCAPLPLLADVDYLLGIGIYLRVPALSPSSSGKQTDGFEEEGINLLHFHN